MTNRKEYHARYYAEHKDKLCAVAAAWQINNKEKLSLRLKKWRRAKPEKTLFITAKSRAKRANIPFDIEETDVIIPKICPYLNIELEIAEGKVEDNSPSLDRIDPTKGYTKGNVAVISHLANLVKNKLSREQLKIFARNILK